MKVIDLSKLKNFIEENEEISNLEFTLHDETQTMVLQNRDFILTFKYDFEKEMLSIEELNLKSHHFDWYLIIVDELRNFCKSNKISLEWHVMPDDDEKSKLRNLGLKEKKGSRTILTFN